MGGRVARWQLGGFLFVCAAGTALHFLYQWSGESVAAAPFAAVNESVWEHMKLLFWPMLLWAGAERAVLGGYSRGFWPAKALGTLLGLALIPALYYTYTGALDVSVMWVDIAIFLWPLPRLFSRRRGCWPGTGAAGAGPGRPPWSFFCCCPRPLFSAPSSRPGSPCSGTRSPAFTDWGSETIPFMIIWERPGGGIAAVSRAYCPRYACSPASAASSMFSIKMP